ncbi:MAG: chemotaxis protein CheR [Acidipila sp.]|nr:chemotaxis protein CheR [Acidipila sp.]
MKSNPGPTDETDVFAVVAIGASAGGLEAFTQLLSALPNNTGMAFVLIQHLAPTHHSLLSELLAKKTKMPVLEAKDGTTVEPNHVYVIPPNVNMGIQRRRLQLTPRTDEPGLHVPVDFFMRSLAGARHGRSIGVVLSGTGSDGTRGLDAIKAEGGITFAQDEKSAKHSGMPQSAIASGCVDFVMPPDQIARELGRISGHPYLSHDRSNRTHAEEADDNKPRAPDENFERIFALVRKNCAINFSQYKPGTVQRRTLRRMAIHKIEHVSDYAKYLEKHPQETENLCNDLLIPVTSFFRDLKAFEVLKTKVFPVIAKDKTTEGTIRIWAPGCSTGEETYSLAMILLEFLGDKAPAFEVQIFGTDANDRGIEKARAGIYSERILEEVSPERLRRFFTKVEAGYRVSKSVRDLCVFAKQNLAEDPPFSHMNLVACRNLLIYLGPELQKKVLNILHYALRSSGFLFLGNSENVASFPHLFAPADKKHKIFIKKAVASRLHYDFSGNRRIQETPNTAKATEKSAAQLGLNQQNEVDNIILKNYAPPGVVINENMEILQFRGAIGPYIELVPGRASLHLLKIAKREFVAELRAAVNLAKKNRGPVKRKAVELRRRGQSRSVNISVEPVGSSAENQQFLILFERTSPSVLIPGRIAVKLRGVGRIKKKEIARLARELATAEEHLSALVDSKAASDEEFQSANEEILSANEELQSTNEELETSKEELQSANEELNTVNDELQSRNLELDRANSDLNNVLTSTNLPVVMVDRGLRIRRLTAASTKTLKVLPSDIGRPITDLSPGFNLPNLGQLIAGVVDTLIPIELEIQDREGHWYSLQIRPYRTTDDKIDGAVIVLSDIDEAKKVSEILEVRVAERTASVRKLSLKIMTLQDEQHRSIARELHDSVGQHLASAKMTIDLLQNADLSEKQSDMLSQVSQSLEHCMKETRTISHLLHPPLIDELGFSSSARWFVEGFSERSGIKVNLELGGDSQRLPFSVELPLFRVLQASLSNVHRHAESLSVDVRFNIDSGEAKLEVRDHGKGIDRELLGRFNLTGTASGIGLASMRERMRELGGRLEIESDGNGTVVRAVIPVSASNATKKPG